ncbi:MAG: glycosyltransferase [Cruoricaptor ignavus]|nr:glycosyltransferase [Cruoricaptor ignavus]
MESPLVTISIPLYKCEDFLVKCLESVRNQTYQNLEVTLINDQTPDNSVAIAEQYIQEHQLQNWNIYHLEENGGLSVVRNKGIDTAQGKYLFFLDSDDTITPDCIETLVKIAEKNDLEMVVGNTEMINLSSDEVKDFFRVPPHLKMLNNNNEVLKAYTSGKYASSSWNKLLLLDFIKKHQLYFTKGLFAQDELQSFQTALVMNKIGFVPSDKITLHYYLHKNSVIHNRNKRNFDNWQTIGEHINKALKQEKNKERRNLILQYLVDYKHLTLQMNWRAQKNPELWKESYANYKKLSSLSFSDYFSNRFSKETKKKNFMDNLPTNLGFKVFKKRWGG